MDRSRHWRSARTNVERLDPNRLPLDLPVVMPLRAVTIEDAPPLAKLYRDSVRGLGAQAYSAEQVAVWASYPDDFLEFRRRILLGVALVSLEGDAIAAFGQLEPDDHISLLYTATPFARRGHATAIYHALETTARSRGVTRLGTTASRLSRPFFTQHGFDLLEVERNHYKGVEFERFKMAKRLDHAR
jgi:putative acetyltransferase